MFNFIKTLFCKHDYHVCDKLDTKDGYITEWECCSKCGKIRQVNVRVFDGSNKREIY